MQEIRTLKTYDHLGVCKVADWPPKWIDQPIEGWELTVWIGDKRILGFLCRSQGCGFRVGEFEFEKLIFVKAPLILEEDEPLQARLVFSDISQRSEIELVQDYIPRPLFGYRG